MIDRNILIAGDYCPLGQLGELVSAPKVADIVKSELLNNIGTCDLFTVNLETPLTNHQEPIDKYGSLIKADASVAQFLKKIDVDLVALANNHILDYGESGLNDTLEVCKDLGMDTVGAGISLEAAAKLYIKEFPEFSLGIINIAEKEFSYARTERAGANPLTIPHLLCSIKEAKKAVDEIVLIIHGGLENVHYPSPDSVRTLRFLAEQGVSAIIRHHSHRVQGYEVWKGVPIFYGIAHFMFDWYTPVSGADLDGLLVKLTFNGSKKCDFECFPVQYHRDKPFLKVLSGDEKLGYLRQLEAWSTTIKDAKKLEQIWEEIVKKKRAEYMALLSLPNRFAIRVMNRLGLLHLFRPSKFHRRILENYIRCDAHREILERIFEEER